MTRAPRIAIVGGGVGGLAAALALERHGAEIVIIRIQFGCGGKKSKDFYCADRIPDRFVPA
jgi:phytoene desaturase